MADYFHLDPAAVRTRAANMDGVTDDLTRALADLNVVLDENDGCWGTDDVGNSFSAKYDPTVTRENAKTETDNLSSWSEGVRDAVGAFQQVDEDNASGLYEVVSDDEADHRFAEQLHQQQEEQENG